MPPSDRFKPIQRIASHRERKAAAALGESLKQREAAQQRLTELVAYLTEYQDRFRGAAREGLSSSQALEYQVFIAKLERAIAEQKGVVARLQRDCDSSKADWRGRYSRTKAMEHAVDRLQSEERRQEERREQAETDDRPPRKA